MIIYLHSKHLKNSLFLCLLFLLSNTISAQQLIKGLVLDIEDRPLINATIYKDGRINEGYSITSYDGRFEITASLGDTLVISCIGYITQKATLTDKTIKIILEPTKTEVAVVTGLGISRTEQELGYAIQSISKKEIEYSKTHNFLQALNGRIVGAQIQSSSAGPTSAVSILIRGGSSITGENQPLFVLNGMPITNDLFSSGDGLNGSSTIDFGDAAQIVGVDDIESISILRGASSAIAYGSRAANGVVLITTKNGEGKDGWSVRFNSSTVAEIPLKLPDYQNKYGSGGDGKYSYNGGTNFSGSYYDAFGENWGPRLNGTPIKQWNSNGTAAPFNAQPNNIRDFYRVGINTNNNIDLIHGTASGDFRLSFSSLYKTDIVPNSNLHKNTMLASFGQNIGKKVTFRANALYTLSGSDNIPNAGYDESSSIAYSWLWFPRNGNMNDYKNYWKAGQEDTQQQYSEELKANNPWFIVNENTNNYLSHRFIANAVLSAEILPGLSFRFRGSADVLNEARYFKRAFSTKQVPLGSYRYDDIKFSELNIEALLSYQSKQDKPFSFGISLVGNMMRQTFEFLKTEAPELIVPGVYNLNNSRTTLLVDDFKSNKGANSMFATITASYKKMIHIELAGRGDRYSTVAPVNSFSGAYLYPSATISAVITEIFKMPKKSPVNFAKIRFAYGQVQADTDPFQLKNTYNYNNAWGQYNMLTNNTLLKNPELKPEVTESLEAGFEIRFFENRLSLDATFYRNTSKNLIFNRQLPISSGYTNKVVNDGVVVNQGVEIVLKATPIKTQAFSWDFSAMGYYNNNTIISLGEGVNSSPIVENMFPSDEGSGLSLEAAVGQPLGVLTGYGFLRDGEGQIIHENGLPVTTSEKISLGSYRPDWIVGFSNTINYQNFSLSFLFDGQIGGKIYSRTHALANAAGTITNYDDPNLDLSTLDGREEYEISYDAAGQPIYTLTAHNGVVGNGVMFDATGNLVANTERVSTRNYFQAYYGRDNIEAATFDATYIKLREVRLSYSLPQKLLKKVHIKNITISLIGRNLALFSAVPTIDPETFSIRNNQIISGFESGQLPSTMSFGFNLNIEF